MEGGDSVRKALLVAVIIGLVALSLCGIALASASTLSFGIGPINSLGDGGGPPEPVIDYPGVSSCGDGGGPPEPCDLQP